MGSEWLGWCASGLLLITLAVQIHKQWRERSSRGVSTWLFIGQVISELAFLIYSLQQRNWVFAATNAVLVVENFLGLAITLHFRKSPKGGNHCPQKTEIGLASELAGTPSNLASQSASAASFEI